MKNLIKSFIPPIFLNLLHREQYGFFGSFKNWSEAAKNCSGYDSAMILEKVKAASLKVKRGEAAFERDSMTFEKKEYSWNLLAPLLSIANKNNSSLNVADFGGSLGSTYFQNLDFLKDIKDLKWNVVEQKNFVEAGKELFETEELHFYDSMSSVEKPDVILFGSSLQYMENPYTILEQAIEFGARNIIIERTPFHNSGDLITVQKVPPRIYDASYPAWIFNAGKMKEFLKQKGYNLIAEQKEGSMPRNGQSSVELKELLFQKNA
jgi:putative methyltransferase (TIGR04325 family)